MNSKLRIISLIIIILAAINIASCTLLLNWIEDGKEEKLYREAMDSFFTALENRDADGIRSLFSKSATDTDADMEDEIDKLLAIYPDEPTQVLFHGLIASSHSQSNSLHRASINSTFPIFCGGEYFWITLELVYEDDACADNIGISYIQFFTAEEYCIYYHGDETYTPPALGFHLLAEKKLENTVICIDNCPYEYVYIDRDLSYNEVKSFLKANTSYSDFLEKFGQPNSSQPKDDEHYYLVFYEVFIDGVAPVYVELCIQGGNEISYANLVNSTSYLENIFE